MSQTTEAQTTQPASEEVIGKVNESIAALQEAQKTVVEGAQLLAAHVNDPTAHGAAIPEVVEQQLPTPVMEGTSLKWKKKDGTIVAGPVDLKGEPGQNGVDGDTGPRPEHRWEGTKLLVQNSDGSWPAEGVDLKGDKGDTGQVEGLSDAVDSNSSTTPASSKAVKTTYDKAVTAQNAAETANSAAAAAQSAAQAAYSKAQAAQNAAENIDIFNGSTPGLVPAATESDTQKILRSDGTWGNSGLSPISEMFQEVGSVSGTCAIDLSAGLHISATIAGDTTFSFGGVPDEAVVVVMKITAGGSAAITWPTSIKWAGGKAPKLTAAGIDIIVLTTSDSGVTWYGIANLEYA